MNYTLQELDSKIEFWANEKGLIKEENKFVQLAKLMEEAGELAQAIIKGNALDQRDAIGDCFVVLSILAKDLGFDLSTGANHAWKEIEHRTGKMSADGSFIKD